MKSIDPAAPFMTYVKGIVLFTCLVLAASAGAYVEKRSAASAQRATNEQLAILQQKVVLLEQTGATPSPSPTPPLQYLRFSGKVFSYDYPAQAIIPAYNSEGYFQIGTRLYSMTDVGNPQNASTIADYIAKYGVSKVMDDYTSSTVSGVIAYTTKNELLTYLMVKGHVYTVEMHDGSIVSEDISDPIFQRLLSSLIITQS